MKILTGIVLIGFGLFQHHSCNITSKKTGIILPGKKNTDTIVALGGPVRKLVFSNEYKPS